MSNYDYSSYYSSAPPPADGGHYASQQYAAAGSYAAAPYPASYGHYSAAGGYGAGGADDVRTIFITGFPTDMKERELNNLLRFMPGYEASQMTWKNGAAQGFALFATPVLARSSCDAIMALQFDENSLLRCEMARKNMYVRDMEPAGKRARTGATGSYAPGASYGPAAGAAYRSGYTGAPGTGDNPPCNTLFVGNLTENVNEAELNALFSPLPGFRQLKVVRGRNTTAFVEFDNIDNATHCLSTQQGAQVPSNVERGGLRIQYSRNPFGRKRDAAGGMIEQPVRATDYGAPMQPGAPVMTTLEPPGTGLI